MTYLYKHYDKDGVLLYVGITGNVVSRHVSHVKNSVWFCLVDSIVIEKYSLPLQRLGKIEAECIRNEKPLYNLALNPDQLSARKKRTEIYKTDEFVKFQQSKYYHSSFMLELSKNNAIFTKVQQLFLVADVLRFPVTKEDSVNSHLEETKPVPKKPFLFRKYVLEVLTAIVVVVVYSWHIYLLVAY